MCGATCRGRCTLRTLSIQRTSDWTTCQAGLPKTEVLSRDGRACNWRQRQSTNTGPRDSKGGLDWAFSEDGLNESIFSGPDKPGRRRVTSGPELRASKSRLRGQAGPADRISLELPYSVAPEEPSTCKSKRPFAPWTRAALSRDPLGDGSGNAPGRLSEAPRSPQHRRASGPPPTSRLHLQRSTGSAARIPRPPRPPRPTPRHPGRGLARPKQAPRGRGGAAAGTSRRARAR